MRGSARNVGKMVRAGSDLLQGGRSMQTSGRGKKRAYRIDADGQPCEAPAEKSATGIAAGDEIVIDGSQLEGGGQILRMGMALAVAGPHPLHLQRVRAKRSRGGLQPQHLTGVELVAAISQGRLEGAFLQSGDLRFHPGPPRGGHFYASPGTAGSTTLLVQAALPCLLLAHARAPPRELAPPPTPLPSSSASPGPPARQVARSSVRLEGGTDAPLAPPVDFLLQVLLPTLRHHFGLDVTLDLSRRGFYPQGGGELHLSVGGQARGSTSTLPPLQLAERGRVVRIRARAFSAGRLPPRVAQLMLEAAEKPIRRHLRSLVPAPGAARGGTAEPPPPLPGLHMESVQETESTAQGTGAGILLVAHTSTGCLLAGSRVLERGRQAEEVGREAGEELVSQLEAGGCVDQYLQDQLIVFLAMARGTSRMLIGEPTLHTRTAIWVAERLTSARFRLIPPEGEGATPAPAPAVPPPGPRGHPVPGGESCEAPQPQSESGRGTRGGSPAGTPGACGSGSGRLQDEAASATLAQLSATEQTYAEAVRGGLGGLRGKPWLLECEGAAIGPVALACT